MCNNCRKTVSRTVRYFVPPAHLGLLLSLSRGRARFFKKCRFPRKRMENVSILVFGFSEFELGKKVSAVRSKGKDVSVPIRVSLVLK